METVSATALRPNVDVTQASRHLEVLHLGAPGIVSLILLGRDRHERHSFFRTDELVDQPTALRDSREALQEVVDARWNVYVGLATFAHVPEQGRGTRADVLTVPGVWADIDVKPDTEGYYVNEHELTSFVQHLPRPTLEIASGSGGRHLYWLTHERLEARPGQELLLQWLDFLRLEAGAHTIEHVHDTTRVLRLAGTVRWPKVGDTTPLPQPVRIVDEGPRYHAEELRILAEPAHETARAERERSRAARLEVERRRLEDIVGRGLQIESYERIVRLFNLEQDWAPLLETTGWTLHSDQRDTAAHCRYWTRPGKRPTDGKSASTDFTSANGATSRLMTIYSNDPQLDDIRGAGDELDAVGVCSKWRYALVRIFNQDEAALLGAAGVGRGRLM